MLSHGGRRRPGVPLYLVLLGPEVLDRRVVEDRVQALVLLVVDGQVRALGTTHI